MHDLVLDVATIWLGLLLAVCAVLVLRVRGMAGRILALDTLMLLLVGELVLYSYSEDASWYLDAALALSVLGFVATTAAALFQAHGEVFR